MLYCQNTSILLNIVYGRYTFQGYRLEDTHGINIKSSRISVKLSTGAFSCGTFSCLQGRACARETNKITGVGI